MRNAVLFFKLSSLVHTLLGAKMKCLSSSSVGVALAVVLSLLCFIQTECASVSANGVGSAIHLANTENSNHRTKAEILEAQLDSLGVKLSATSKRLFMITIVGVFGFLLILLIIIVAAISFRKKLKEIHVAGDSLEHDAKILETLNNHLTLFQKTIVENTHSLSITAGTEVFRMRKRLKIMPDDTPGRDALKNALGRLENELSRQGYVVKDLTGQPYVEELTVEIINSIASKDIKPGKPIISRMIKPQIFYNNEAIYHGEAELAISPEDK
jgi:uncharacterized membrane protein (DUF485 family)